MDASITVDRPLKLPISTIVPFAGAPAASKPRNRASPSCKNPGTSRTRCQASSMTASRLGGSTGIGVVDLCQDEPKYYIKERQPQPGTWFVAAKCVSPTAIGRNGYQN